MHHGFRILAVVLTTSLITSVIASQVRGQAVTTIGGSFNASGGVAVDASGNIYVADFGAALSFANGTAVWKVTPDGSRSLFASGLAGASGNAFDSAGNLLQSNIAIGTVSRINPHGAVTLFSTGHSSPVGIAIDADDNVFVANCGNRTIRKVTADGSSNTQFAFSTLFNCPNGLTIDEAGTLYAANFSDGRVLRITPSGDVSTLAVVPGGGNGHLTYVNGVMYVVSRSGNRIYEVTLAGEITLIAGSGVRGNSDGPALQATFSVPNGIAASPSGEVLYINSAVPLSGGALNPVLVREVTLGPVAVETTTFSNMKARYRSLD